MFSSAYSSAKGFTCINRLSYAICLTGEGILYLTKGSGFIAIRLLTKTLGVYINLNSGLRGESLSPLLTYPCRSTTP